MSAGPANHTPNGLPRQSETSICTGCCAFKLFQQGPLWAGANCRFTWEPLKDPSSVRQCAAVTIVLRFALSTTVATQPLTVRGPSGPGYWKVSRPTERGTAGVFMGVNAGCDLHIPPGSWKARRTVERPNWFDHSAHLRPNEELSIAIPSGPPEDPKSMFCKIVFVSALSTRSSE